MDIITDLHVHSAYAGGCSKYINLEKLEESAEIKGINLLGTGDFTHPKWFSELNKLEEDENGILWSKNKFPFLWQTEISLVYTQDGKGRRIHLLMLAPNKETVKQINDTLIKKWRVDYDGRPIFGISCIEFLDLMLSINKDIELIPAHCWTSWFAIFGSKSGFDSVEECFKEKSKHIHALESGMSSDPKMNWRLSKLDKYNIVSFSDLHSYHPWRIGREATIFDCELRYKEILNAIRTGNGLKSTIETPPVYGKYHYDGHRLCNVFLEPKETRKLNKICPKCKRELTIGVEYRIEELADRPEGFVRKNSKPFVSLVPLTELIAKVYGIKQLGSKKVWEIYNKLIKNFGNEYNVLLNSNFEDLKKETGEKLSRVIIKNRENKLNIKPGYDGVYGEIILNKDEVEVEQKSLVDF